MPITPDLSKKLLDLKEESGLSYEQIGMETGTSDTNVRRYLRGETKVSETIYDIYIQDEEQRKKHICSVRNEIAYKEHLVKSRICPKCNANLVERNGRNGVFLGCSNYPKCKNIQNRHGTRGKTDFGGIKTW